MADQMSFPPLPHSPAEVGDLILQTREHVQSLGWGNREQLYAESQVRAIMAECAAMAAARERQRLARGLREYRDKHGYASDAVAMPRAALELLAEIEPVDEHEDNGPGRVVCPACGAWMSMRWSAGARLDEAADMAHNVHCPAVWARNVDAEA